MWNKNVTDHDCGLLDIKCKILVLTGLCLCAMILKFITVVSWGSDCLIYIL